MTLLIVLFTLALVQIWGSGASIHRDDWFAKWCERLDNLAPLRGHAGFLLAATLLPPVLAVAVLMLVAQSVAGGLGLLVAGVPLLLYCLGRGDFHTVLANYLCEWYRGDLTAAAEVASPLLKELHEQPADGRQLHEQVFRGAAYCAFERLFAVLFWFIVLGMPGALLFRLSALYAQRSGNTDRDGTAGRWLWLLEWLPVRVMGISFAIVGNFAGCHRAWRQCLMCHERDTAQVLEAYLEGALGGIDASECGAAGDLSQAQRQCGAQIEGLQALLSRALLLWVTALALVVLFA
ncbi:regulatory signaling modulator protein AmpE [Microbulbifer sp. 2205BS26-8]|uniref:regulatory signaling modulator protein AmpE n=1 Tax=Microbulbifer sp. 2205BS26-8 TaxID=3064386 RepID=UPI00273E3681|nr:regulatory signaling modulator protein AmpE [Microbulbifer sp. 2205BS26-8]MDP5210386.1 regulatory signaling modulator protein AmpE [Microbulbifer sp. 2205BS26-8]